MGNCVCNNARQNTGVTRCKSLFLAPKKIIFVPTYADDGTRNKIESSDTLDSSFVTTALNANDDLRWYPIPVFENGLLEQAETTYETPKSGKKYPLGDGIKSISFELFEQEFKYLEKLNDKSCGDWSAYIIDVEGNTLGETDGTDCFPLMLADGTLSARPKFAEEKTSVPKLMVNFDFDEIIKSENLIVISKDEFTGVNLLTIDGLLDVEVAISSEATDGFIANLTAEYGTFKNKIDITGFEKDDFTLHNVTTDLAVVITSVTESPDGTYTFVIPAQSNDDILRLTASKNGYEFPTTLITIPSS